MLAVICSCASEQCSRLSNGGSIKTGDVTISTHVGFGNSA